jgi:predicted DNA-binding protein (MmcQ/YjbR family)
MTRRELIDFCLTFPAVYEDYPFDGVEDDHAWAVMRHRANKKSFALIYERHGRLCVNLKCDPLEADFLRRAFVDVTPAYHMNKVHWNTVALGGDVPEEELKGMLGRSYELIRPGIRRRETGDR